MKAILLLSTVALLVATPFGQYRDVYGQEVKKFGISVKAGPAFPNGDFANLFGTGFTGFVEVPYAIARGFCIYAGVGVSKFSVDNSKLSNELGTEGVNLTTNVDAPYLLIPIVLGINVSYKYAHVWPYFTFSGGIYLQTLKTSGSYTANGVVTTLPSRTESWTQGAYSVGLGTLIPLGDEGWAVDLNAKFNSVIDYEGRVIITPPSGESVSTRAIKYVSVLAGLSYTFH